ncbi:MAG: hypothetical protein LBU38_05085 [Propionibacteriaceae bacterium]|jgi:hypothetical protein|nr:hypothetical protein [Propionibacteriaceae bacterium]
MSMEGVEVHPRVNQRHPEVTDADVLAAWANAIAFVRRETDEKDFYVAVGSDSKGRLIEVVASRETDGQLLVFHAMTPPTRKTLTELGLVRR